MISFDALSEIPLSSLPSEGSVAVFSSSGIINDTVVGDLSFVNFASTGIVNDTVDSAFISDILFASTGVVNDTITSEFKSFSQEDFNSLGVINDTITSVMSVPSELSSLGIINDDIITFLAVPKIGANVRCRFLNNNMRVRL